MDYFFKCFSSFSACSVIESDDQEWFFLCPIEYKYAKSKRFKRTTDNGFWKATGNDRSIKIRDTNKAIGTKKTLVYHEGLIPGVKTNWIIHEYHDATLEDHQVCYVYIKVLTFHVYIIMMPSLSIICHGPLGIDLYELYKVNVIKLVSCQRWIQKF